MNDVVKRCEPGMKDTRGTAYRRSVAIGARTVPVRSGFKNVDAFQTIDLL
jgi:hypothetical protein